MRKQFLQIGKIVGTHGVRGMVRIEPWADEPAFLKKFKNFYLEDGTALLLTRITPHGNIVIAAINGTETVEDAEKLRGKVLSVKREDFNLPDGRYLIDEIIGAAVFDRESGKKLGVLTDVFKTGANDVWQITEGDRNYLFPVIDEAEISVDIDADKITLKALKGIFDDEN